MSQAPSMPMFWDAYLADTTHLTTEEHGAYMLLLMTIWSEGGVFPNDEKKLARVVGLTLRKWRRVWPRLRSFFVVGGDGIKSIALTDWEERLRKLSSRPPISHETRDHVFSRDGQCCVYCGDTEGPFELDHIMPWSRGGNHDPENLVVSCRTCNRQKSDRTPDEMGWLI